MINDLWLETYDKASSTDKAQLARCINNLLARTFLLSETHGEATGLMKGSIESRTSYEVYPHKEKQADELVFYHGGFHSLAKKRFLKFIIDSLAADVPVLHWGDIDLGGLRIFSQICTNVAPGLQPWRMDRQTLQASQTRGLPLSPAYRQAVEKTLADPLMADFADVLKAMLEMNLRLEQENLAD